MLKIIYHLKKIVMRLKHLLVASIVILSVVISAGCQKSMDVPLSSLTPDLSSAKSVIPKIIVPQKAVDLGMSGNFVILSKSGITDVYKSTVTGDIGTSPITGAAIHLTCAEVTGTIYSVNAAGPLPCAVINPSRLTTAVGDMQRAYTDAAGRSIPDFVNLGAGNIGSKTLTAGLYKFTSAVILPTNITISGGPDDIWIFQIAGTLTISSAVKITLAGGAQAKNIYWQVAGAVTLGTTSHFEGVVLGMTGINMQTGASINGRLLAQTAVTLQMNTVNYPQ